MQLADMHCDTLARSLDRQRKGLPCSMRDQDTQITFEKMRAGGYTLQNFAVFVNMKRAEDPLDEALRMISLFYDEMEKNRDIIAPVQSWQDIENNRAAGRMSALLTLEEGGICKGDPAFLAILHRLGARMMTLTWNFENELGYPNFSVIRKPAHPKSDMGKSKDSENPVSNRKENRDSATPGADWNKIKEAGNLISNGQGNKAPAFPRSGMDKGNDPESPVSSEKENKLPKQEEQMPKFIDLSAKGLKEQGIFFLEEMERLGMVIDVSHLSDAGFYDVLKYTKKPFVASHSNARAVCGAVRNLTDDMAVRLANRGGLTGINFCDDFLGKPQSGEDYLDRAAAHMKYLINLCGEDFVGLGSDFDGIPPFDDLRDCTCVPKLVDRMEQAGLSCTQIEKICYKNVFRIYKELLP